MDHHNRISEQPFHRSFLCGDHELFGICFSGQNTDATVYLLRTEKTFGVKQVIPNKIDLVNGIITSFGTERGISRFTSSFPRRENISLR